MFDGKLFKSPQAPMARKVATSRQLCVNLSLNLTLSFDTMLSASVYGGALDLFCGSDQQIIAHSQS